VKNLSVKQTHVFKKYYAVIYKKAPFFFYTGNSVECW